MKSGRPLTDADRAPWLAAIADVIDGWRSPSEPGVVTCSVLKRVYRRRIIDDRGGVSLIYLGGSRRLIAERLATRQGHLMLPSQLDSQFVTLEPSGPDENPIAVGVDRPVTEIVETIVGDLRPSARSPQSIGFKARGTP